MRPPLLHIRGCSTCDRPALILMHADGGARPLCIECLGEAGVEPDAQEYICSVEDCWMTPEFIVVSDETGPGRIGLCSPHFQGLELVMISIFRIHGGRPCPKDPGAAGIESVART